MWKISRKFSKKYHFVRKFLGEISAFFRGKEGKIRQKGNSCPKKRNSPIKKKNSENSGKICLFCLFKFGRLTETGWNFLGNFLTEIGVKSLIQRISKKFPEFFTANFRILIKRLKKWEHFRLLLFERDFNLLHSIRQSNIS